MSMPKDIGVVEQVLRALSDFPRGRTLASLVQQFDGILDAGDILVSLRARGNRFEQIDGRWRVRNDVVHYLPAPRLRAGDIDKMLANSSGGLTIDEIADRFQSRFSRREIAARLFHDPSRFRLSKGRWTSVRVILYQTPRVPAWTELGGSDHLLRAKRPFGLSPQARESWHELHDAIYETAFDPNTTHFRILLEIVDLNLDLHVDHTATFGQPAWVIWKVVERAELIGPLDRAGFHFWRSQGGQILEDPDELLPMSEVRDALPVLATWVGRSPLKVSNHLTWTLTQAFRCTTEEHVRGSRSVRAEPFDADVLQGFRIGRRVLYARKRGQTIAFCQVCGRALSDAGSAALGIGPECAQRQGRGTLHIVAGGSPALYRVGSLAFEYVKSQMIAELDRAAKL